MIVLGGPIRLLKCSVKLIQTGEMLPFVSAEILGSSSTLQASVANWGKGCFFFRIILGVQLDCSILPQ